MPVGFTEEVTCLQIPSGHRFQGSKISNRNVALDIRVKNEDFIGDVFTTKHSEAELSAFVVSYPDR